ncbi:MAG TPA: GNAT family N-acetyltransferase [Egibacteraceae bacterium]|nr:GNAT family N-acetyltransferase [Egibacteraceae bacterium]
MTVTIRSMTVDDVEAVAAVVTAADRAADREAGREPEEHSEEQRAHFRRGMRRFVERDGAGAFVAEDDGTVVGMAEAIRRGTFWGLSMLFVHPDQQSKGLGRQLLDATLTYAEGATVRMIMSSPDPRAMRRYALAGHAIHPAVDAEGTVDRSAIPGDLRGRTGDLADLDLVEAVDRTLRGSRAEDVEWIVASGGARLEIVDDAGGRGWAVHRDGRVFALGATDTDTASAVLWRALAETDGKATIWCLTAAQDWAVRVTLAARMSVSGKGSGAMFIAGMPQPPGPWIPSGWYF